MSTGERLRQARKLKGKSQDELAKAIGVSRGVITNIEYDKIDEPQPIIIDALAKILSIRKDWLLTGDGEMDNNDGSTHSAKTLVELYEVAKNLSENEQLYLLDIIKAMKQRLSLKK